MPGRGVERAAGGARLAAPAHLFALWGFAVAQPLYDLCGQNAELFVAHGSGPAELVLLAVLLSFLLPAVLWLAQTATGFLHPGAGRSLHRLLVAGLVALVVLPLLREPGGFAALGTAGAAGVLAAAAYAYRAEARAFLTFLSPSIVIFPAFFLFDSSIAALVFGREDTGASPVRVDVDTPVVLVVFDEIPLVSLLDETGGIDPVLYPSFAELGRGSHWFRNATAVAESTTRAVPAILTGRYPDEGELPTAGDQPDNLFTLLGGSYELTVTESVTRLCPERLCSGATNPWARFEALVVDLAVVYAHVIVPPPFSERLPSVRQGWGDFLGTGAGEGDRQRSHVREAMRSDRKAVFEQFLARLRPGPRRLHFLHLLLPHAPWAYLPSGKAYTLTSGPGPAVRPSDEDYLAKHAYQRHLLQLGMVDGLLGPLLRALREDGIYDSSLLIVVADHGVSFRPGEPRRDIRASSSGDILWVPFFVKLPGQRNGTVSERNVQTFDVLPTIADVLDLEIPFPVDGRSVFEPIGRGDERKIVYDEGERLTFASDPAPRDDALRRKLGLFGSRSRKQLFRIGPAAGIVGRRVDELPLVNGPAPSAAIDAPELLRAVDLKGDFVPAHLTGRIDGGPLEEKLALAAAVNGVVRTVGETFLQANEQRFSLVVPEEAFRQGENDVELFAVVKERNGGRALRSLGGPGSGPGREVRPRRLLRPPL